MYVYICEFMSLHTFVHVLMFMYVCIVYVNILDIQLNCEPIEFDSPNTLSFAGHI